MLVFSLYKTALFFSSRLSICFRFHSRSFFLLPNPLINLDFRVLTMKFFTAAFLSALLAVASAKNVKERIREFRQMQTPGRDVRVACWYCVYIPCFWFLIYFVPLVETNPDAFGEARSPLAEAQRNAGGSHDAARRPQFWKTSSK